MNLNVLRRWLRTKHSWVRVRLVVILRMSKRSRILLVSLSIWCRSLFLRFLSRLFRRFLLLLCRSFLLLLSSRLLLFFFLFLHFLTNRSWTQYSKKWIAMFWFVFYDVNFFLRWFRECVHHKFDLDLIYNFCDWFFCHVRIWIYYRDWFWKSERRTR